MTRTWVVVLAALGVAAPASAERPPSPVQSRFSATVREMASACGKWDDADNWEDLEHAVGYFPNAAKDINLQAGVPEMKALRDQYPDLASGPGGEEGAYMIDGGCAKDLQKVLTSSVWPRLEKELVPEFGAKQPVKAKNARDTVIALTDAVLFLFPGDAKATELKGKAVAAEANAPKLLFASPDEFRAWIEANHRKAYDLDLPIRGSESATPDSFLRQIKELDYPAMAAKAKEGLTLFSADIPEFDRTRAEQLADLAKAWENSKLDADYWEKLDGMIEKAYEQKRTRLDEAMLGARHVKVSCEGILVLFPGHARAKKCAADVGKIYKQLADEYVKQGIVSSPFQLDNMGRILFSAVAVNAKKADAASFAGKFSGGNIYATAYLPNKMDSLTNAIKYNNPDFEVDVYVRIDTDANNVPKRSEHINFWLAKAEVKKNNGFWQFEIAPDPASYKQAEAMKFLELFQDLQPKEHEVCLEVGGWAEGCFKIDLNEEGQAKYTAIADKIHEAEIAKVMMPKAVKKDAKLQKLMTDLLAADGKSNGYKIKKLVIADKDFYVYKDGFGNKKNRTITGAAGIELADGKCELRYVLYNQDWNGDKWTALSPGSLNGRYEMLCKNIK